MPINRSMWIDRLDRIARPVMTNLAAGTLHANMPIECNPQTTDRAEYTHLEAFGRLMCGIAPWLEISPDALHDDEQALHGEYRELAIAATAAAVDPASADRLNFEKGMQSIVDAAFLAHAVVRAPKFFLALPGKTIAHLVESFKIMRTRKPGANNWLLFASMTEAGIHVLGGQSDLMRVDYAVRQHEQWYLGGGVYGDGPLYHGDYYNSFVIQPMLIDTLRTFANVHADFAPFLPLAIERGKRYAEILERSIAPDGTYPATGRSIAYRCGAFQHLAQMALQHALPASITPAQCRGVLTKVITRTLDAAGTFDADGWLRIGLSGHQPALGEPYISTGSLYLCASAFLPLGLPPADPFWAVKLAPSSWEKAWSGVNLPADKG